MHPELKAHSEYFQKEVVQLADNVYMAFGFAASNVCMIIGDDKGRRKHPGGVPQGHGPSGQDHHPYPFAPRSRLRRIGVRRRRAARDPCQHEIFGRLAFRRLGPSTARQGDGGANQAPIRDRAVLSRRNHRHRGRAWRSSVAGNGAGGLPPTRRIGDEGEDITRCGVDLQLVMAPGETPDHMVVWYPQEQVLFSGDNFYRSFPNLYAIRGTAYRDFDAWADTMDLLMSFQPEVLAPGHTKAVVGAARIQEVLTDYRDAIRYVVNETRGGMDEGLTIDELAHKVKLQDALAEKPHLREYYGRVDHAVRAYFVGTMGWFDGNPTSLNTLAPDDEAVRFIGLAGGPDAVFEAVETARSEGARQWALQLVDRLINAGEDSARAVKLKSEILLDYADEQINCPTRHYYIQCSKELAASDD